MKTPEISTLGMIYAFASLGVSLLILTYFKINLRKDVIITFLRMTVQLLLVGFYLEALFSYNNPLLNIGYIVVMITAADYTILRNSGFTMKLFASTFPAYLISIGAVLIYYIVVVFSPPDVFDARFIIPISGMLLGNSMTRTVVTLDRFYDSIRKDSETYLSYLSMGATQREAMKPFFRQAYRAGMAPALATYSAIGLVSLPGMMTGQILGGSDPMTAVKYQIVIIMAIFAATEISTLLALFLSLRKGFDKNGFLNRGIFRRRG